MRRDYLICSNCEGRLSEGEFKFLDISSDIHGRDVIKFECRKCGKESESFVFIGAKR